MRKKKDFDCVEMKREIQARLQAERERLGEDEARRRQRQSVLEDSLLGPLAVKFLERSPARARGS